MVKKELFATKEELKQVPSVLKRSRNFALIRTLVKGIAKFSIVLLMSLSSCSDIGALKSQSRTVLIEINKSLSSQNCARTSAEFILKQVLPTLVEGDEIIITVFDVTGVKSFKKITNTMVNGKKFKKEIEDILYLNEGLGTPLGSVLKHIKEVAKTKNDEFLVFVIGDLYDEKVVTKSYVGKSLNLSTDIINEFKKEVISLPHTVISFLMIHPDNEPKFKDIFNEPNVVFHSSLCGSPKLSNEDKEAIEKSFKLIEGGKKND